MDKPSAGPYIGDEADRWDSDLTIYGGPHDNRSLFCISIIYGTEKININTARYM